MAGLSDPLLERFYLERTTMPVFAVSVDNPPRILARSSLDPGYKKR